MSKPKSIFLLPEGSLRGLFDEQALRQIQAMTLNDGQAHTRESILEQPAAYEDVEIIFSGWGAPEMDVELLERLPGLKAFFYAAGSVRGFVTDAFWRRDILLTSAYLANAVPVAQYTVATVVLSLKKFWYFRQALLDRADYRQETEIAGVYSGSRVGIISLGAIGRMVSELLSAMGIDVYAYDPFVPDAVVEACGARRSESLESLFRNCDVVSLHAPLIQATEGMVTGDLFRAMPRGATFINTARGKIVNEGQMIEVLKARSDLQAILDVAQSDPDYADSPLLELSNVTLTPHIAGSMGRECYRLGEYAVEECRRYLNGQPPVTALDAAMAEKMT